MIRVIVQRCLQYPTSTFGIMCVDDEPEFLTVENPWLDNQRNISCIPKGIYTIRPHTSPTFGKCLAVDDVPGRSHILIHAGNTAADTRGCILVGTRFGNVGDMRAVMQSRMALTKLLAMIKEPCEMEVRYGYEC
jgi:hypothetical protein